MSRSFLRLTNLRVVPASPIYRYVLRSQIAVERNLYNHSLRLRMSRSMTTSPDLRIAQDVSKVENDLSNTASFDLAGPNNTVTKIHVRPSYPHKPKAVANLTTSLPELLTDAIMPTGAIQGFSTQGWDLDESNDTIHRYVELSSQQDVKKVIDAISDASKELNHDPHIHTDGARLTISCTTHVPPGLSMKDVKLARKINEILETVELETGGNEDEAEILTKRQRAREQNMDAVRQAKLSCSCG